MAEFPLPVFHFQVDWGGTKGAFSEVTGLGKKVDVISYRDGLNPDFNPITMPGLPQNEPIGLKRGVFKADNEFYDWFNSIKMNTADRRDVTISLLDEEHAPVMTWKLSNCWPTEISSPELKADSSEVAFESIQLSYEGMSIENA